MRPLITQAHLFSCLVTRQTGRTVRVNIERQWATADRTTLAVLDMRNVPIIDFSCADEIVAKLVSLTGSAGTPRRFVLFRGVGPHHLEPIESVLTNRGLVAALEDEGGEPFLAGDVEPEAVTVWQEVARKGRVPISGLASHLGLTTPQTETLIANLESNGLLMRDGDACVSLGTVWRAASQEA